MPMTTRTPLTRTAPTRTKSTATKTKAKDKIKSPIEWDIKYDCRVPVKWKKELERLAKGLNMNKICVGLAIAKLEDKTKNTLYVGCRNDFRLANKYILGETRIRQVVSSSNVDSGSIYDIGINGIKITDGSYSIGCYDVIDNSLFTYKLYRRNGGYEVVDELIKCMNSVGDISKDVDTPIIIQTNTNTSNYALADQKQIDEMLKEYKRQMNSSFKIKMKNIDIFIEEEVNSKLSNSLPMKYIEGWTYMSTVMKPGYGSYSYLAIITPYIYKPNKLLYEDDIYDISSKKFKHDIYIGVIVDGAYKSVAFVLLNKELSTFSCLNRTGFNGIPTICTGSDRGIIGVELKSKEVFDRLIKTVSIRIETLNIDDFTDATPMADEYKFLSDIMDKGKVSLKEFKKESSLEESTWDTEQ